MAGFAIAKLCFIAKPTCTASAFSQVIFALPAAKQYPVAYHQRRLFSVYPLPV